jgi:hypothetical protein
MLTGRLPFEGRNQLEWRRRLSSPEGPAPPRQLRPEISQELEAVCLKCLEREPSRRYGSAAELAEALRTEGEAAPPAQETVGIEAAPETPGPQRPGCLATEPAAPSARPSRLRRGLLVLAAGIVLLVLGGVAVWRLGWLAQGHLPPLGGDLDLRLWQKGNPDRHGLRLHQPGALPVRPKDQVRTEVELIRPAYLYVVYLDNQGEATPLFPWRNYDWKDLPAEEPRTTLVLPPDRDGVPQGAPIPDGPSGIDTYLLLAREQPLPAGFDVEGLFRGLSPQKGPPRPPGAVWYRNGEEDRGRERDKRRFEPAREIEGDPLLQLQALLKGRLRQEFGYSRAVCFTFQGSGQKP